VGADTSPAAVDTNQEAADISPVGADTNQEAVAINLVAVDTNREGADTKARDTGINPRVQKFIRQ